MIAVMGAAGHVGGKVTDLLLHANEHVRIFEHRQELEAFRRRGAEVVPGDAMNVEDLRVLFQGASAALVLLPEDVADPQFVANRSRMSHTIADALGEALVGHVVALSAVGAERDDAVGPPAGLREFEQRLCALEGFNVLILRSAFYMDNLLASLPLIQTQRINGSAIKGDVKFPMLATQDVAREAAARLRRRDFSGHQVKMLLGPEDVSMHEATRVLGSLLGQPDLPYIEFPPEAVKAALLSGGMSEEAAALIVDMQLAINEGRPFGGVQRTAETATPTRLEEFLINALSQRGYAVNRGGGPR